MQKKHSFSPNHKVVTDSKHNFHPHGNPSTADMGSPPQSVGGGGGEQPGGDSDGASMGGMNFCNGGMKYADGGGIAQAAHDLYDQVTKGKSTTVVDSSGVHQEDSAPAESAAQPSRASALAPVVPGGNTVAGRKSQIDNAVEDASK